MLGQVQGIFNGIERDVHSYLLYVHLIVLASITTFNVLSAKQTRPARPQDWLQFDGALLAEVIF
jgi:hypothetical protein